MTNYTLRVASPDIIGKSVEQFNSLFIANKEQLFAGAIFNSGLYGDIYRRVPKADRQRYGKVAGKMQLTKSILPGGPSDTRLSRLPKTYTQHTLSYVIGSDKPYAKYVHEATKPGEGVYWDRHTKQSQGARGWSTPGTGNKFLEKPARDDNAKVMRALEMNIEQVMRRSGMLK